MFSWGFFPEMMEMGGSLERFIAAPLAQDLLHGNADLRAEFDAKIAADEAFASDAAARLQWLVDRSLYANRDPLVYPIMREVTPAR